MNVMQAIENRRSIRVYENAPVSREQLTSFLEAIRLAPSWKNGQCWQVLVLSDRAQIMRLGELLHGNPRREGVFENVPYFIAVAADPALSGEEEGKSYYMADVGIALENACLAATDMGLGTCWIGLFDEQPIKEFLGIPDNLRLVALTPLGVPAQSPHPRPRKALADFVHDGVWGKPLV